MENSGIDIEAIINGDTTGKHDIFKEYLKNKENELLEGQDSSNGLVQANNPALKKANTIKQDQKKNKELMVN
jgi:hypothetical protein